MNFLTSLFIFLIPTLSLIVLQYFPYLLAIFWNTSSQKLEVAPVSSSVSSSVWCSDCNRGHKCCEFRNLYYFPKEKTFGFVLSESSNVHGISSGGEFQKLLTSSVLNHTEFFLPLVVFAKQDHFLKTVKSTLKNPIFLLNRFKPDNVMHALHDEILPLFSRYESLCLGDVSSCTSKILLSFFDENPDFNLKWYKEMSKESIFNLTGLQEPVLISEAHVGLPGDTVVYQYGFGQPQGPVSAGQNAIGIFQRFAEFFKKQFNVLPRKKSESINVLLITRKETRRILNEHELLNFVMQSFQNTFGLDKQVDVKELDLNSVKSVRQIIIAFSNADLTIGMHGAATFLAGVFSKPNSTILELFPYGISPAVVSPLHSLSRLNGCWFSYASWENKDARASVPPAEDSPDLIGGLATLSEEERNFAKKQIPVPAVYCCHNATYLYRMFQDTIVGPSVQYSILKSIEFLKKGTLTKWTDQFRIPGRVRDVVCLSEVEGTKVFWKTPLNAQSVEHKNGLIYELTAMTTEGQIVEVTERNVFTDFENRALKEVWVRACSGDLCGQDNFVTCV